MKPRATKSAECAVCRAPIGMGHLMCASHWHQVPQAMQREVIAAWGRVARRRFGGTEPNSAALNDYRKARDAAVALVQGLAEHHSPPQPKGVSCEQE